MNISDTAKVLAKIKLGDNREVDAKGLVLTEWHENIGDLVFEDAIAGVTMHRKESADYLTFAHVRINARRARDIREREARRSAPRAIEAQQITLDRAEFERMTQAAIAAKVAS